MSKLLLTYRETEHGFGKYLPSVVCVRVWCFQVDFFFPAEIQFSSDQFSSGKAHLTWDHWPQAGMPLTLEEVVCISSWLGDQRQLHH